MAAGYLHALLEQVGVPGNETNSPTTSTKLIYFPLIGFTPALNPEHLMRDDELRNTDQPLMALPERYGPQWDMEIRGYPDTLGFLLSLTLGLPTTTAGDGIITDPDTTAIPAGAWRHVWTAPFGPSGAFPQTAQFQGAYKDQSVFFKLKGAGCASLGIETPETGGMRVRGSGPALYMTRISDPSLTAAYESLAIRPFTRSNLTLPTWLSGTAVHEDFSLTIDNPMEPYSSLGIASRYPDMLDKGDPPITFTGSLPQRYLDADDYDALVNATGFTAVARWVSDSIIASSYPYKLYVQFDNAQYVGGGPNALENKRRLGASFDFKGTYDGAGASVTVTLVNATSSYA